MKVKVKVKVTLVQALRLCTGRTAYRGSRGIVLLFHDHGTRKSWEDSVKPRPLFTPGKDPVPIVQEARWAPGPVWTGAENLPPPGIRSQDLQSVTQSLYRLSYPAHYFTWRPMYIRDNNLMNFSDSGKYCGQKCTENQITCFMFHNAFLFFFSKIVPFVR